MHWITVTEAGKRGSKIEVQADNIAYFNTTKLSGSDCTTIVFVGGIHLLHCQETREQLKTMITRSMGGHDGGE